MKSYLYVFLLGLGVISLGQPVRAQSGLDQEMAELVRIPAVSGYEQELAKDIRQRFHEFSPTTDNLGNVFVTIGNGSPHRLLVAPIDEPGYAVSDITREGFLRVQRLPQAAPNPVFDTLHFAQPVWVMTRAAKKVPGVFAGLSVHLQPARVNPPKMNHPDEMYVDIGATSAADVRAAGVQLLDPIALNRSLLYSPGVTSDWTGVAVGDRFGAVVLLQLLKVSSDKLLRKDSGTAVPGTTTIAFITQQWTGGRGLDRLLNEIHPDEMIYLGRFQPGAMTAQPSARLESGILLGVSDPKSVSASFAAEFEALAAESHLALSMFEAAPPRVAGYARATSFPERFVHLGVPVRWPTTPVETVSSKDVSSLASLLEHYLHIPEPINVKPMNVPDVFLGLTQSRLERLAEVYAVSGHEDDVRREISLSMLPAWAKPDTDAAGNLVLHLGSEKPGARSPKILFIAHMDEIGYQVHSIEPDGRLLVDVLGGGFTEYFMGHPVLIHTDNGERSISVHAGILEPPAGWDQKDFEWPHGPRSMDEPVHVYVGTRSSKETEQLGIKAGDWITIPKEYRSLLGKRANARSFDDRVGCAALIEAVNALGPDLPGRDVTFIWSTEEEVGLKGAAAAAERMAKEGRTPDFVFAIDTFVSSDSPLESKRFADAEIGKGFVVRAVDNSNITPREYVDRVVKLARDNGIPAQYGVTGGGNDGATFTRYGSVNIPLGWPLRYSHSPGEVIDTRDLDALAKIITVLAKSW